MALGESKILIGILAIALGVSLLLSNVCVIHDTFGLFVAVFFVLSGIAFLIKRGISKKHEALSYLILLFFGLSLFALEFYLLPFTTLNVSFLLLLSIGISYLVFGTIFQYSFKSILTGLIFVAIALLIFLPKALLIEDIFWLNVKKYLLPILFIAVGVIILFPWRKK